MADNTVQLSFNDKFLNPDGSTLATYSGSLVVDYTTSQVTSGSVNVNDGYFPASIPGQSLSLGNQNGTYTLSYMNGRVYNFSLTYTGQLPTTDTATFFDQAGSAGSTTNNPAGTQNQPISASPLCFAAGTLIETECGDIPIEKLTSGNLVRTSSGALRPIVWTGRHRVTCSSDTQPICILAGAFGSRRPKRDLLLSPGHPVLIGMGADEILIPIRLLVNGRTIYRKKIPTVDYWHVELDAHDILLAEGLPAESFLDYGVRAWFENAADHAAAHPDYVHGTLADRCRPVAFDGPRVEAERRRLKRRSVFLVWSRLGFRRGLLFGGIRRRPDVLLQRG